MTPADLAAAALGDALDEPRLPERYSRIAAAQELCQAAADSMIALRAAAVAGMNEAGMSYADIAAKIGLSRARVQQLTEMGRDPGGPVWDDEIRSAVLQDATWWILRFEADNALIARTRTQVAARVRRDIAEYSSVPAGEPSRIAAEAESRAGLLMETMPGWDQTALERSRIQ